MTQNGQALPVQTARVRSQSVLPVKSGDILLAPPIHTKSNHLDPKSSNISSIESIVCGSIAGLFSRFIIAPLDVVKIRFQLEGTGTPKVLFGTTGLKSAHPASLKRIPRSKIIDTLVHIAKTEGLTGLWKGNVPAELLYICYGACQFTTYSQVNKLCQSVYPELPSSALSFISGSCAGCVATCCTYPFDLLRTRFAAQGVESTTKVYTSLLYAINHIYNNEGIKGFFRGVAPAVASVVPYMGLFFLTYNQSRSVLSKIAIIDDNLPSPEAVSGLFAGAVSKSMVFPLDVIRKRLQVQGPTRSFYVSGSVPLYPSNFLLCGRSIVVNEGIRALYRGCFVSLLKSAPASAVTIWTFENSLDLMRTLKDEGFISY